jgi:hypothetical protein
MSDTESIHSSSFSFQTECRIVAEMTESTPYTGLCWGNLMERDHLEDPGVDGMLILRLIFRKWDGGKD